MGEVIAVSRKERARLVEMELVAKGPDPSTKESVVPSLPSCCPILFSFITSPPFIPKLSLHPSFARRNRTGVEIGTMALEEKQMQAVALPLVVMSLGSAPRGG